MFSFIPNSVLQMSTIFLSIVIEALQLTFSIIPIKLRSRTYHFYHKRENENETNH